MKEEQALRSSLPPLSRQIVTLAKTRGEVTVKETEESTGANRNTIKVHVKKLAEQQYLRQVGKGRGSRYTMVNKQMLAIDSLSICLIMVSHGHHRCD